MFQSIWSDIKYEYAKKENYLMRIILVNIAVFIVINIAALIEHFVSSAPLFTWSKYALYMPVNIESFLHRPWTLLTTFITHKAFMHILFNMLGLYWFGRIVEDLLGPKKVLALYVLGGIVSSLTVLLFYNTIPYFIQMNSIPIIGASGSVFAIAVAAATISPNYSLHLLLFGPVRIKYIVAVYIFLSFIGTSGDNAGGHLAHLGGALFGFIFVASLKNGRDLGRPVYWLTRLFDRKPKLKITHRNSSIRREGNETPNQDEIDRILDKINRSGYESLSKEEKQKLFKASQNQQ